MATTTIHLNKEMVKQDIFPHSFSAITEKFIIFAFAGIKGRERP